MIIFVCYVENKFRKKRCSPVWSWMQFYNKVCSGLQQDEGDTRGEKPGPAKEANRAGRNPNRARRGTVQGTHNQQIHFKKIYKQRNIKYNTTLSVYKKVQI